MVIWPQKVCRGDEGWNRACALLQVLALDPRRPVTGRQFSAQQQYFESAEDFLVRPKIWVDRKLVPAPYYTYALRFNVSASVHGAIPVIDTEQLEEFKQVVSAALHGELSAAERKRWEADAEFRRCCAANDPMAEVFSATGSEQSQKVDRYYRQVREAIEASRQNTGYVAASLSRHEEVLDGLIRLGATLLKAA